MDKIARLEKMVLISDKCQYTIRSMIKRFQHRGLKRLYEDDDRRGINVEHVEKVRRILGQLKSSFKTGR